jgi:hypothetical protein
MRGGAESITYSFFVFFGRERCGGDAKDLTTFMMCSVDGVIKVVYSQQKKKRFSVSLYFSRWGLPPGELLGGGE